MIWVAANDLMPGPLVYDIVAFDGITYTVHVKPGHGDASGGSAATWFYIAFKTREPLLSGTLNIAVHSPTSSKTIVRLLTVLPLGTSSWS